MRNLKKILALALALVMTLSVMSVANAAFTDEKDFTPAYTEAAEVLTGLKVLKGYTDGSFAPKGEITRAEVAAIVYRIVTGDVNDRSVSIYADYAKFSDVNSNAWYAGYVGYCSNAELIKGYGNGKFGPNDKVTGYQALALILRAVGYGQNKEFEGAGWDIRTSSTATGLGILKNVNQGTLGQYATRELVAEIIFQAINVPTVTYTPALGYNQYTNIVGGVKNASLGYKTFKLVEVGEVNTTYGRPAKQWNAYNAPLVAIAYTPVYESNLPADECDVSAKLGLAAPATVSQAWLDGVNVTAITHLTSSNTTIDPLHTAGGSNIIGDQGRKTEIYRLANGTYSIVEFNTYFAQVVGVTPSVLDKNNHPTAATIDLKVYVNDKTGVEVKKYPATGYAVGDTVLVTLDRADIATNELTSSGLNTVDASDIASIEAVAPVATGVVNAYSNKVCNTTTTIYDSQAKVVGTVTVGGVKYNSADKFFVGNPNDGKAGNTVYSVYQDGNGNVIALLPVTASASYAVINAIRWNSPNYGTTVGGYVTANLTLADGTVVTDVTVSTIDGVTPRTADSGPGVVTYVAANGNTPAYLNVTVSNAYYLNSAYYYHLVNYAVNTDGSYSLYNVVGGTECVKDNFNQLTTKDVTKDLKDAVISKGKSTIYGLAANATSGTGSEQINVVYASDKTVFLVLNADGYTYTAYEGYLNVPSIEKADICYITDSFGRVALAVVKGTLTNNNVYQAFLANPAAVSYSYVGGVSCPVYTVYKVGSAEPTYVPVAGTLPTVAGFYSVAVNNGVATLTLKYAATAAVENQTYAGYQFDMVAANTGVVNNSIATTGWSTSSGVANKNFDNVSAATYFLVKDGTVTTTSSSALKAGQSIFVFYTQTPLTLSDGTTVRYINNPVYIYIQDKTTGGPDQDVDVTNPNWKENVPGYLTLNEGGQKLVQVKNSTAVSLGSMADTWTAKSYTLTITQNGVTTVVASGNNETVSSALLRGATLALVGADGTYTVVG